MSTSAFRVDVRPGDRAAFSRPSFAAVTRLELRKILDVRSGPALLLLTLLLALVVLAFSVVEPVTPEEAGQPVRLADLLGPANQAVVFIVPVLGLLAMTSEWTQRTALTTFTLVPRRVEVLLAKLAASVALGAAVSLLVAVLAAVATALRGALRGLPTQWGLSPVGGSVVAAALAVLMGAALGALVMSTAPAVVAYYIGPTVLALLVRLATPGSETSTDWVNVEEAFGRLSSFDLQGKGAQTLVAVAVWVVLPMLGGLWRSLRRDAA